MIVHRSPEWHQQRLGKVTASRIADVMAKTKTGYGASRGNYMAELLVERLTGNPTEGYINAAMQHGIDTEPKARAAYQFMRDVTVDEVSFIVHPHIAMSGASPNGFVGNDGLVEFKCPQTATHIETLLGNNVPGKYVLQIQYQLACAGRSWCDFVSFDPRLPASMRLFVHRIERDDYSVREIEEAVRKFLAELDANEAELRNRYEAKAAA